MNIVIVLHQLGAFTKCILMKKIITKAYIHKTYTHKLYTHEVYTVTKCILYKTDAHKTYTVLKDFLSLPQLIFPLTVICG
jgi:hypothetical protein